MKQVTILCFILLLATHGSRAQIPLAPDTTSQKRWTFGAEANFYFLQNDFFILPVLTADYSHLHLETRYNYEDFQTLSIFAGYTLATEGKVSLALTPMLGTAIGNTTGIIPAMEATISWANLELYTETEWLIDPASSENNFLYTWSDLTYAPWDHYYFGISGQRTRLIDTGPEIERGLVAGYFNDLLNLSVYTYNIGTGDFFVLLNTAVTF